MRICANTRPDLSALYHHASMSVLGWPVSVMFMPVHWDFPGHHACVELIGRTANGWHWQTVSEGVDLYRFNGAGEQERLPFYRVQEVAHV